MHRGNSLQNYTQLKLEYNLSFLVTADNIQLKVMYVCMYVCMYVYMYVLMYDYIYVLFVCRVWPHMFGLKPLLGLEPMAPIRPQNIFMVSHANHSVTETSMYVCRYVCVYVCMYICMYVCMYLVIIILCLY